MQVLTTGEAIFPNGKTLDVAPKDWIDLAKWIYGHIDGPPKQDIELSGPDRGPIEVRAIDYRAAIANLAPGSVGDSDESGEN